MLKNLRKLPLSEISFSILATILFLFYQGYAFNTGDHAEHLVPLYEKINPGSFKGDFFMDYQAKVFTNRDLYVWALYLLSFIGTVSFWCFSLNCLAIFSSIFAWLKISYRISANSIVKYVAPLAIFFVFYGFTIGGNQIMYGQITTATIAKAIVPWAIFCYLRSKYQWSAAILGLATLFHPIVGLQLFLIFSALFLFDFKKIKWRQMLCFITLFLLVASPILYLNFNTQFFNPHVYDKNLYNKVYYHFRNPHHYLPSQFPLIQWIKYLAVFAAFVALVASKARFEKYKTIACFVAIQTLGALFYSFLIEGLHNYSFAAIQWFKSTIWVVAFTAIILCDWLSAFNFVEQIWRKTKNLIENSYLHLALASIGLFFILNSKYIPLDKFKNKFEIGSFNYSELDKVHSWIKSYTPIGSLFIAPPSDFGFGCETLRPTIINAKALVQEPRYMLQWYERYTTIYKTDFESVGGKSFVEKGEENYRKGNVNMVIFSPDYGLVYQPYLGGDTILYESKNYAVVKFGVMDKINGF